MPLPCHAKSPLSLAATHATPYPCCQACRYVRKHSAIWKYDVMTLVDPVGLVKLILSISSLQRKEMAYHLNALYIAIFSNRPESLGINGNPRESYTIQLNLNANLLESYGIQENPKEYNRTIWNFKESKRIIRGIFCNQCESAKILWNHT